MIEKEFRKALSNNKSFKEEEKEAEYLLEIVQYWITNYSPGVHATFILPNGKKTDIGWLKDVTLVRGGNKELDLLRYAFAGIKKNTIFAD